MTDLTVQYGNVVKCYVHCDRSIALDLRDFFTFTVPGYQFSKEYKAKRWDGKIRLYNIQSKTLYVGLIPHLKKFAKLNDLSIEIDPRYETKESTITPEEVYKFCEGLNIHSKGEKISPRPYQYLAIYQALKNRRKIIESPTSSGKSLVIYSISRYLENKGDRVLIIVPTVSLVEQLCSDFEDYASEVDWDASKHVHMIYGGKEKDVDAPITISTWQSIFKLKPHFFKKFKAVIVDECHKVESKSITSILEKCTEAYYRIGLTGTLKDTKCHKLVLQGLLGTVSTVATTKDLMDKGQVANLDIECIILRHNSEDRKKNCRLKYHDEIDYISTHYHRNQFIADLAIHQKRNTLILFNRIDHGNFLVDLIHRKLGPNRKLYFIYGATPPEERERIRKQLEKEEGSIVVASYGTFSTGVSVKNIHYIIFASPTKSKIRTLQSIGRGLRLHHSKEKVVLYDIADDISWKKKQNTTLKHYIERVQIYNDQKFSYRIQQIKLPELKPQTLDSLI